MIRAREVLDRFGVEPASYEIVPHPRAVNAEAAAQLSHVRGRQLAVARLVRDARGQLYELVAPASEHLDLEVARRVLGTGALTPASPPEIARTFPGCDPEALPPFGTHAGVPTVLDLCFFERAEEDPDATIWFEAGNHLELVAMPFAEFRRRAGPFAHEACLHDRPRLARVASHGGRGARA